MTTIAYKNGILAADKMATFGSMPRSVTKIKKLPDGSLVGGGGELAFLRAMFEWLEKGANAATFPAAQRDKDDWQAVLHVTATGELRLYERTPNYFVVEDPFYAAGSGRDFAMMAMHLGKSAPEAVELTAQFDVHTGRGVDTLTLPQPLENWQKHRPYPYAGDALAARPHMDLNGASLLQRQSRQTRFGE